jgi:hypothetical protein
VELGGDDADRRFDPVLTDRNASDARQRDDEPDHAVPAHSEVAHVVEEDDARRATRIDGLAEEGADHDVRPARFGHDRGAVMIIFRAQPLHAFAETTDTEVRSTFQDDARRLPLGVRIDDPDTSHP